MPEKAPALLGGRGGSGGEGPRLPLVAARWLTVIQSARLHEIEPLACITDLLDRLAVFRDLPPDRKSAELDEHMATLLPDAWIVSHQDARLPNAR